MQHESTNSSWITGRRLRVLALGAFGAAALVPAWAEPSRESQEEPVPVMESGGSASVEVTPQGEWLKEEGTGKEYRIDTIPKVEGSYQWVNDKEVRLPLGVTMEVLRHDDKSFWVKNYKPHPLVKKIKKPEGPTAEELAALEEKYRFELDEVDRLTFEEFDRGLPRSGQWRNGFDLADMNADGHLDLVFGPARKGRMLPNVFLGDSQGNWRRWEEAVFPDSPFDYGDVEAADFNGDGAMDLAFGIHLRGMLVIVGDGEGRFSEWTDGIGLKRPGTGDLDSHFSSRALDSVDWNGDGKLDVLAFGEGPQGTGGRRQQGVPKGLSEVSRGFLVYLNKGDGSWESWRPLQGKDLRPNFGDSFEFADLNGDEFPDLVTVSRQMGSQEILRLGTELGKFEVAALGQVPRGMVSAVAAGDLDGDGHDDLAIGYLSREHGIWRTGIDLFYGASDMTWRRETLFSEESRRGITALALGNLDGDGSPDLAALTGRGETWIFLGHEEGEGQGSFLKEKEELTPSVQGCQGYGLALVDFDGDGRDEVVASFAGETTGMPGLPGLSHPGCRNEGSLRAWKAKPSS